MQVISTELADVKIFEPKVFGDDRGFFMESYNQQVFKEKTGLDRLFVQDNHSRSVKGVLRGLHYQIRHPQGKLVRAVKGEIFDVAVDIRPNSPSFGQWFGTILSEDNKRMLWIPEGFAHGFLVLSDQADVLYKATDFYDPQSDRSIRWDDPDLAIQWPIEEAPALSPKDQNGKWFKEAEFK